MSQMTWEKALRDHDGLVFAIARQYLRPGIEMKDLVQEGRLALHRSCSRWEAGRGASFRTIANGDIRNALVSFLLHCRSACSFDTDKISRRGIGPDEGIPIQDVVGTPPEQLDLLERAQSIQMLRDSFNKLPAAQRDVLWSTINASDRVAAERTGSRTSTVRNRRMAALKSLRTLLLERGA